MTKQERQEMMAKARAAKALKTGQDTVQETVQEEPMLDETDIEYDFSPYEVVKEQQEYGCRFILLLNGVHKAEFHGEEAECYKDAEAFIERGDKSKVVNVNVD
jgi:hypothetical protein